MERSVEEVVDACTRLLADMKRGTQERTMLSTVTKTLRRRLQEAKQLPRPTTQTTQITPTRLERGVSTAPASSSASTQPGGATPRSSSTGIAIAAGAASTSPERPASATSTPPAPPLAPALNAVQLFLLDEAELSKLAYACRLAIVGENGSIARGSVRLLTASLELAAVVLSSGMLPQELNAPVPVFMATESSLSGAQVFFSRLLGNKKSSTISSTAMEAVNGSGPSPTEPARPLENMRDMLVDAVLSAVDAVPARDASDRLFFVAIVALQACAVPRLSRESFTDYQLGALRPQQLAVHGGRLVHVFRLLLSLCSRPPGVSSILTDEAQKAVHSITRAISKFLEHEGTRGGAGETRGSMAAPLPLPSSTPMLPQPDALTAPSCVVSSVTGMPLASPTAAAAPALDPLASDGTESGESTDEDKTEPFIDGTASSRAATAARVPQRVVSFDVSSATPVAPLILLQKRRGETDMRLLVELCSHIARIAPLSGLPAVPAPATSAVSPAAEASGAGGGHRDPAGAAAAGGSTAANSGGFFSGKGGFTGDGVGLTTTFPAQFLNTHTLMVALSFLLYNVINGGPRFRKSMEIVQLLRQLVMPAAVRTSVSADLDVFRLSVNLLLACCQRFNQHMVNETSTVFRHVYFRVLDSNFTSLDHKLLVLDAFASYIEEPQQLLELFLNYDCNTRSQSIYEMMIHYLGALAMPAPANVCNATIAAELKRVLTVRVEYDVPEVLRRKALVSLLQVADSNIQWIERFECDQEEDGNKSCGAQHGSFNVADTAGLDPDAAAQKGNHSQESRDYSDVAALQVTDGSGGVTAANADVFLQARRYKDAFRKFLDLFNVSSTPDAAIEYLKNSSLTLTDTDGVSTTPATLTPAATPEPQHGSEAKGAATASVTKDVGAAVSSVISSEQKEEEKATKEGVTAGETAGADIAGTESEATGAGKGTAASSGVEEAAQPMDSATSGPTSTPPPPPLSATSDVDDATRQAAQRVAVFLRLNEEYIDKMILGDYFAKSFRRTNTRVVFEEWIAQHDFTNMTLDAALRLFLGGFKLLGEAQVVDRTMELFAAQYCRQNPGVFGSADTAFILSFSICMLNTDAHSPHIKNKMSRDGFLQNNKGIDEGNDVDPAILGGIYDRIFKDEIVLRPSPKCATQMAAKQASDASKHGDIKVTTSLLDSIPLLRHLAPIAAAITDTVLLPMDGVGAGLFGSSQRKREEMYQRELRTSLKAVMDALQEASTLDAAHHAMFVTATSIENALPMWEVTVDIACHIVLLSLQQVLEDSERYVRPQTGPGNGEKENPAEADAVAAFIEDTNSANYFSTVLSGLHNTVRVCCAFGNVTHTEKLLEHMFEMTHLSSVIVVSSQPSLRVTVQSTLPFTRLHLLTSFLNLFVQCGSSFNARGWQAAYKAMSLVDALANGVEGLWRRQTRRLRGAVPANRENAATDSSTPASPTGDQAARGPGAGRPFASASVALENRQYADLWFGALNDVPSTIVDRASRDNRKSILSGIRAAPMSHVDMWLDHLFDATKYSSRVQLEMTNGLVKVCEVDLQYERTFSMTKLFDFVSTCATFSSRMQWRELWRNASEVFTLAGCGSSLEIALSSLDGLRLIALTYLMREELLNYSFQKEVLRPFESILMSNQNVVCRQKVMAILAELLDFRAEHFASGWNVLFSCLSHAAAIPEVAPDAWSICETVMTKHIDNVKDCFSDLIFCLTTFACSSVDENMPLQAISYLIACGHWLQYGLDAPPLDARATDVVARWAVRFANAEQELAAAAVLGRHLPRVTLAADPLTRGSRLQKPNSYTVKTNYHLWMSLFEGMVPIVVVHSSVRVRAHALSCIWALLARYAVLFSEEAQQSLFSGMVRPMLTTLITHVPEDGDRTSPPLATNGEFDRFDYRLLVYFALKGMLLACKDDTRLLTLGCRTMQELVESTKISLLMLQNDYVSEVLRVCYDFVWAAPSLVTMDALEALPPLPDGMEGVTTSTNYAERLYQWIPVEARHRNPFAVGLVHEIQQTGVVDVVRFKRTAGWTELHQTPAARNLPVEVNLSEMPADTASVVLMQVRTTVYSCLTRGLVGQLHRLLSVREADHDVCLSITAALRRVLLCVSFYFLVTRDTRAMGFIKAILSTSHDHGLDAAAEEEAVGDGEGPKREGTQQQQQQTPPGRELDFTANPSLSPLIPPLAMNGAIASSAFPVFVTASTTSAVETLLLIPYACVLVEFVACFELEVVDNAAVRGDLAVYMHRCADELKRTRAACVAMQKAASSVSETAARGESAATELRWDAQTVAESASDAARAYDSDAGLHFLDVFRAARYPIAARTQYLTAQTPAPVRHRVFAEWCYLVHVYALLCIALLGPRSVLLQACPTADLARLLPSMPSSLEETAAFAFWRSCWEEMNLHCSMPPESCVELCTNLLVSRF